MRTIRFACLTAGLLLGALLSGTADAQSPAPLFSRSKPAQTSSSSMRLSVIGFETPGDSRVPLVSLTFDGKGPFLFGFDPGIPESMIDKEFAASQRFRFQPITTHEKTNAEGFVPQETALQGPRPLHAPHIPFIVTDLSQLRARKGASAPVVGILGANFLRSCVARIDFSKRQIQFTEGRSGAPILPQAHKVTVRNVALAPSVQATVDGKPTSFQIDFMEQYTHLEAADLLSKLKPVARIRTKSLRGDSEQMLRLQSLSVGGMVWHAPILNHTDGPDQPDTGENTLGADFFAHYYVTLDLHANQLSLEPDPDYTEPASRSVGAGFTVSPSEDGKRRVSSLTTPSPASEAGLRLGDEVLAINGLPTATTPMAQIHKASPRSAGAVLKLKVQRKGEKTPREFTLKLRRLL